jgi:hypothetical protein
MKKAGRKRLKLERESVKILVAASTADLIRVKGGNTSSDECSECSVRDAGCPNSTEP